MGKAKRTRTRRVRRQKNAALRHGKAAKPKHTSPHGRTGAFMRQAKKPSRRRQTTTATETTEGSS